MNIRNTLRHLGSLFGLGIALTTIMPLIEAAPAAYPIINEYVLSHPISLPQVPSDIYKARIEVYSGTGGIPAATYTVVLIGGDSGRNANVGRIVQAVTLPATPANSYYCFPVQSDAGTRTILIVTGYTGPLGNNISPATAGAQLTYVLPGTLTGTIPWTTTIDGVAVWDSGKNDITFETTVAKNISVTTTRLNPNFDTFNIWVQGASRNINATDNNLVADWIRNAPNGAGLDDAPPVTVGAFPLAPNPLTTPATFCFDNDNVPLPPLVANDAFTVSEGATFNSAVSTLTILLGAHSVLDNDSDPNLDPFSVNQVGSGATALNAANLGIAIATSHGSVTVQANGTFVYTHNSSENFTDSFTYTISDGTYTSTTATVSITITPVNDNAPVANPDAYGTDEDTTLTIAAAGVLANDTDSDVGTTLSVSAVNGVALNVGNPVVLGSGAIVTLNANGGFTYNPNGNFNYLLVGGTALDTFQYTVSDGTFSSSTTVSVTVSGLNDCPDAVNDTNSTSEDITLNVAAAGLLANDTDPDTGAVITVTAVNGNGAAVGNPLTLVSGAILTLNANGSYTYNPNGVYNSLSQGATANDSFTYTVSDGICSDSASVTITINGTNDCPSAVNDSGTVAENAVLNVAAAGLLSNDTDPDAGASKSITAVNGVGANVGNPISVGLGALLTVNANGSYTFDPNGAYDGLNAGDTVVVSFTYSMSDTFCSSTATVNVTVNGVNNCPVAVADTGSTSENTSLVVPANGVLGNDTDADVGAALFVSAVNGVGANVGNPLPLVSGATITLNANGSFTYNPNTAFDSLNVGDTATDTFNYTVSDGTCTSTTTVTITINGANDCPVAVADTASVAENSIVTILAPVGVLSNDTDADSGHVFTVTAVNGVGANVGNALTLLSGAIVTLNVDGSFSYNTNNAFNALNAGNTATDSFNYTMSDGTCSSSTTVTVTINGENDCPIANPDSNTTAEDVTVSVPASGVLANDTDADSLASLTVSEVEGVGANVGMPISVGAGALITVNANGSYTFNPNGVYNNLNAGDSVIINITYTITDGTCPSIATITISVTGTNDCPVATADASSTNENTTLSVAAAGLLGNDTDVDSTSSLSISAVNGVGANVGNAVTIGGGLIITVNANGSYTANPNGAYESLDDGETAVETFNYTTTDGTCTSTATVTITINGVNDCPVAVADTNTTNKITVLNVPAAGVLTNDTDVDDPLTVSAVNGVGANVGNALTLGSGAIVTVSANGAYVYNPNGAFAALPSNGSVIDSFTYTTTDGTCSSTATVTITVTGVNNCPVAIADVNTTTEDAAVSSAAPGVLGNDTDIDPVDTLVVSALNGVGGAVGVPTPIPSGAIVTLNANGSYTYNPNGIYNSLNAGDVATDSFTYTVTDGLCPQSATVTITINGQNDCPVANNDSASTNEDTNINVAAAGLLLNDTDADSLASLSITAVDGVGANVGNAYSVGLGALLTVNANGSYSLNTNGAYNSLNAGDTATITFTYTISDGTCTSTATVTITITGLNDCPIAIDDTGTTNENTTLNVAAAGVISNDTDADSAAALTVSAVNGVGANVGNPLPLLSGAIVTLNANGGYAYNPNGAFETLAAGQTTTDSFTYTLTDGTCTSTATVTITITGVNDCPIAVDDVGAVNEDDSLSVAAAGVLANDTDIDAGATRTVSAINGVGANVGAAVTLGSGAIVTLNADGSYIYNTNGAYNTLNAGQTVTDSFTYTMTDGICTDDGLVTITITGQNDCPVATADTGATNEDSILSVAVAGVLANDSDIDSAAVLTVSAVNGVGANVGNALTLPSGAIVTLNANGSFVYNPNGAFENLAAAQTTTDSFTYIVTDGTCTSTATVTITITGVNDCPVANADVGSLNEDDTLTVAATGVLANDTDVDTGAVLTVTQVNGVGANVGNALVLGSGAIVTVNADGSYTYNTNGVYNGLNAGNTATDSFTYTITDGTCTSTATVTITINGQNDCPVANADVNATDENTPIVVPVAGVLTNDTDSDSAAVLTVSAVNGVGVNVGNALTLASGAIVTLNANGSYTYNTNGAFEALNAGQIVTDSFTYTVTDGTCTSTATVTITITGVNDCPVANADVGSLNEDDILTVAATGILSNDTDVDSAAVITVSAVNGVGANVGNALVLGSGAIVTVNADGSYTYNTNGVYTGLNAGNTATDSFTYTITDGTCTSTATVTITITGQNDCPVGNADVNATDENTPIVVPAAGVIANDTDADTAAVLTVSAVNGVGANVGNALTLGSGAIVTLNADGSYTYNTNGAFEALNAGQIVTDSFTYTVTDGTCTSTATVTVTITGVNDCPVANADSGSVNEDDTLAVAVTGILGNDTDVDSAAALTVTAVNAVGANVGNALVLGSGAIVTVNADGSYIYNTNGVYTGLNAGNTATDSFTYTISDGTCTSTATVTITINGQNDCPIASVDTGSVDENSNLLVGVAGVLTNDTDADAAASLTVSAVNGLLANVGMPITTTGGGVLTLNANGSYTFTTGGAYESLAQGATTTESVTYTVSDGTCTSDTTLTITITGVNDCPVASPDAYATDENTAITVLVPGVLVNDTDVDTAPLTAVLFVGLSTNGAAVSVNTNGSFSYDPTVSVAIQALGDGATLVDTFSYTVTDGLCTDTDIVSITVTGVNEAPVANDDAYATDEDAILNVPATGVLANDSDADLDPITITTYNAVTAQGAAVVLNADGSFSYDPTISAALQAMAIGDTIIDTFSYTISDGVLTDSATVSVTVNGKNDAPVPAPIRKTYVFPNGLWSPLNGQPAQNANVNLGNYWQPIVIPISDLDSDISEITVTEGVGKSPGTLQIKIDPPGTYTYDDTRGYWTFNVLIPEGTSLATPITVPLVITDGTDLGGIFSNGIDDDGDLFIDEDSRVTISYTLYPVLTPRFPIARTMPRYYAEGVAFKDFVNAAPLSRSYASQPTTNYTVNWWVAYSVARETVTTMAQAAEDWHPYFVNYFGSQSYTNDQVYWTPTRFLNNQSRSLESYILSDGDDNVGVEESRLFCGISVRGGLSFAYYGHVDIDPLATQDYTNWKSYAFGVAALTPPAAADQDFNLDTVPNAVAYALGIDPTYNLAGVTTTQDSPTQWTITGLPVGLISSFTTIFSNNDNWKQIAYQRNPQQVGVTYTIQYSQNVSVPTPVWTDAPEGIANEANARFSVHLYGNRVLVTDQPWQMLESWQVNGRVKDITNQIKGLRLKIVYGGNTYIIKP